MPAAPTAAPATLATYDVRVRNRRHDAEPGASADWTFRCQAEDVAHAREQALDEPTVAAVLGVAQVGPCGPGHVGGVITGEDGAEVWAAAKRKARYGHRDWFVWRDRAGACFAAPVSAASAKAAMLACGTQRSFTRLSASTATLLKWTWRLGLVTLRQCRVGCAHAEGRSALA